MERKGPEKRQNSVLERIKKHRSSLQSTEHVAYRDVKDIKGEFNRSVRDASNPSAPSPKAPLLKSGRPKLDDKLKARDIRVTIKPKLFEAIEERKKTAKSRSQALSGLLERGLLYEELRRGQADDLKVLLREFAALFSALKIRKNSSLWRKSMVLLEDNEMTLAKLYNKSLQIKHYLSAAHIDPIDFHEVRHLLTKKEIHYLEFSSGPERIATIVTKTPQADADKNLTI